MDRLEEQLKQALGREDPPPGFSARVLARIAAGKKQQPAMDWWSRFSVYPVWGYPAWRVALAGALLCPILLGAMVYMQHRERVRGQAARDQLLLALRITSSELNRVRQVVVQDRGRP